MVNTFLVVADFRESATYLCRMHLGKQRTEAMQVRHMLIDLEYLNWYFEITSPSRGASRDIIYHWVEQLLTLYQELPYRFIWNDYHHPDHGFNTTLTPREHPRALRKGFKLHRAKDNEVIRLENGVVHLATKTGLHPRSIPEKEFLYPHERLLGDGLRKHPLLALWHTYTDALADYINCHIAEWLERGYNNTMIIYNLPATIDYPPWCDDPEFHRTMRARMREKEYTWFEEYKAGTRKQRPEEWYTTMDLFLDSGEDTGYLW